mmetsp:Transcript_7660/g.20619  ORF Transcript_7660/g.20619 Transcript_7660/m.20619 type:complete len:266 (-) Transcript_7660:397-1194(-)
MPRAALPASRRAGAAPHVALPRAGAARGQARRPWGRKAGVLGPRALEGRHDLVNPRVVAAGGRPRRRQDEVVRLDEAPLLELVHELELVGPLYVRLVDILGVDLVHVQQGASLPSPLQVAIARCGERRILVDREKWAAAPHQVVHHDLPERIPGVRLLVHHDRGGGVGNRRGRPADDAVPVQSLHVHQHALREEQSGHVPAEPGGCHRRRQLRVDAHVGRHGAEVLRPDLPRARWAELRPDKLLLRGRIQHRPELGLLDHRGDLL